MLNIIRNFLIKLKKFTIDALKNVLKRAIQKTVEKMDDLIVNKIANNILKVFKISQQNISKIFTNEHNKENIYIFLDEKEKIIDDLKLIK